LSKTKENKLQIILSPMLEHHLSTTGTTVALAADANIINTITIQLEEDRTVTLSFKAV
jgi:hypothetical protein